MTTIPGTTVSEKVTTVSITSASGTAATLVSTVPGTTVVERVTTVTVASAIAPTSSSSQAGAPAPLPTHAVGVGAAGMIAAVFLAAL